MLGSNSSADDGSLNLIADPPAPAASQVATVIDAVLKDLQRSGPTDDELADDLAEGQVVHEDPRSALERAANAAVEYLQHGRSWDADAARAERESVNPSDIRATLADYPATAILTVPHGVVPDLPEYASYPDHIDAPTAQLPSDGTTSSVTAKAPRAFARFRRLLLDDGRWGRVSS